MIYAHSLADRPPSDWEPLAEHLAAVSSRAAYFAGTFGWAQAAAVSGRLHDIGKCSSEFLDYITRSSGTGEKLRGPNHSTAGAREAIEVYGEKLGKILAFTIAGHHAGLADGVDLNVRCEIPTYDGWRSQTGVLPPVGDLRPTRRFERHPTAGFEHAFLIRMLFSCLVDADFLETERFYTEATGSGSPERGGHAELPVLRDRLRAFMAAKRNAAPPGAVNDLRARILDHVTSRSELPPGLFTLTVPTGGGKTLTSLSFALEHAVRHGLSRVIYVIPFTSIVEQTAAVFREALSTEDDVLEHHGSFDWDAAEQALRDDGEGADGLAKLRRAAENWDVPIVVTTAVQFFESLYANRPARCRKLHNIAGSVVVLDEAQTIPLPLLRPCMAAIDELARNYDTSVVLCTATQPALRKVDGAVVDARKRQVGFDIDDSRELAPEPSALFTALKRVEVERMPEPVDDRTLVERFEAQPQMLCIVNSRAHATTLFEAIRHMEGAVHLSTLMCPRHRGRVLAGVRAELAAGRPVRLVATSLVEAGVDIDFPEVWRAAAGLDSLAQAAGRCNREGRLRDATGRPVHGRMVVFEPAEARAPKSLADFWQAARPVLRRHPDPFTIDAVRDYFHELYWQKGDAALDAVEVSGASGILQAISERAPNLDFPFASIAAAFRMIDQPMEPVVVPWRADPDDDAIETLLGRIAAMDRPLSADLRRLQLYTVNIPRRIRSEWLARGVLRSVHPELGEAVLRFEDLAHYDGETGVRLDDANLRSVDLNIIS